jgi:hypothetical protein
MGKVERISKGHYEYNGFKIDCLGYFPIERSAIWEATDENGCGFAHGYTLKEVIQNIDSEMNKVSAFIMKV